MNKNRKVLVTGADGFIGSHLTEMLVRKGYEVNAFCLYNSFGLKGWLDFVAPEIKNNINYIFGDIRNYDSISKAVKSNNFVFHLAALIGIPYSYTSPSSYVDTNIKGTLNVLEACRKFDIEKLIHTSTSETYGSAQYVPINEEHPLVAQSPYAATKIAADQLALSFFKSFNTPVSILRPFNTYGPRQSCRAVIPSIILQILEKKEFISLGSLMPTRDFNYVSDTCEAFEKICISNKTTGQILNAASEYEISIADTVKEISKIMNSKISIISDQKRLRPDKSEVNRLFGDSSRLQELSNWKPKYKGLDGFREGIKKTIDWFINNRNNTLYSDNNFSL
ncbi:NAD-dependent 4,6-dehydratase LegB [Prochlorococcus marinus]|jgi:NAD dependent epimerase/dehydratase|uniref:Nucleoside-diphosphate-sugar epimerase n=1 Tax=Prochlorococcus marinus (strain MIT 9301) TaxID=167546 RepID=A3PE59_PROM0|nr:NAD-dependent 4,6-dehydratase LegB [Prochlorococcus marinus]ABO18034.1 Nucleoside-diphosphate-sugar epimerase [Prochlorococcus marinus str. MIT 9301]